MVVPNSKLKSRSDSQAADRPAGREDPSPSLAPSSAPASIADSAGTSYPQIVEAQCAEIVQVRRSEPASCEDVHATARVACQVRLALNVQSW